MAPLTNEVLSEAGHEEIFVQYALEVLLWHENLHSGDIGALLEKFVDLWKWRGQKLLCKAETPEGVHNELLQCGWVQATQMLIKPHCSGNIAYARPQQRCLQFRAYIM